MTIDLNRPIDCTDPAVFPLLEDLQGNIIVGHGRDHSVHLFLKFQANVTGLSTAKRWIQRFAFHRVTSAGRQLQEREIFRKLKIADEIFANFFLSWKGYELLNLYSPTDPPDRRFITGLKDSTSNLGDPDPKDWEGGYQREIHAAILLASDNEVELNRETRHVLQEVRGFADVVASERGRVMRNKQGEAVEHFGYVDGRSQPLFLVEDIQKEFEREDIRAATDVKYDPSAPPTLVLRRDWYGKDDLSYGSYFVFCKLEQDVRGFKEAVRQLAVQLSIDEKLAAALVVGRFTDGTPVLIRGTDGLPTPIPNNFNYLNDPDGQRCPLHAHIRKTNPRGETTGDVEVERGRRIVRRGITYGARDKEPKDEPTIEELPRKDVGLLFMCFQSDIESQFEFLQKRWANHEDHLVPGTGVDPVIGNHRDLTKPQRWQVAWGSSYKKAFAFRDFVTLKGGEYFFAPSISALKNI
jgi:Dyp-type peroxidase family